MSESENQVIENIVKKLNKMEGGQVSQESPEEEDLLNVGALFTKKKEIDTAKSLANRYLKDYVIETESDKNLLRQLIYLEVIHHQLQKSALEYDKSAGAVPPNVLESLHKNLNQIVVLKDKLGLTRKKNEKEENDTFKSLSTLKKKFKVWEEENQGSRNMICPHCGKMVLLVINMDKWEELKHPFFVDRILANKHLIKLYKENKITKEDIAKVLGTSEDYITRIIEKINIDNY